MQPEIERLPKRMGEKRPAIPHRADKYDGHKAKDRPDRRRKGKYRKREHKRDDRWDDRDDRDDRRRKSKRRGFRYYFDKIVDEAEDIFDIFD